MPSFFNYFNTLLSALFKAFILTFFFLFRLGNLCIRFNVIMSLSYCQAFLAFSVKGNVFL